MPLDKPRLIALLKSRNMRTVSADTGISYAKIAKWVQGKGFPKNDDYITICNYFSEKEKENGISSNMEAENIKVQGQESPQTDINILYEQIEVLKEALKDKQKIIDLLSEKIAREKKKAAQVG